MAVLLAKAAAYLSENSLVRMPKSSSRLTVEYIASCRLAAQRWNRTTPAPSKNRARQRGVVLASAEAHSAAWLLLMNQITFPAIRLYSSSHGGTGSPFSRKKEGLNIFDW